MSQTLSHCLAHLPVIDISHLKNTGNRELTHLLLTVTINEQHDLS